MTSSDSDRRPEEQNKADKVELFSSRSTENAANNVATLEVLAGIVLLVFQIAVSAVYWTYGGRVLLSSLDGYVWAGVWIGAYFMLTGYLGRTAAGDHSKKAFNGFLALNVLGVAVFSMCLIGLTTTSIIIILMCGQGAVGERDYSDKTTPLWWHNAETPSAVEPIEDPCKAIEVTASLGVNAVMLVIGVILLILSMIGAIIGCWSTCARLTTQDSRTTARRTQNRGRTNTVNPSPQGNSYPRASYQNTTVRSPGSTSFIVNPPRNPQGYQGQHNQAVMTIHPANMRPNQGHPRGPQQMPPNQGYPGGHQQMPPNQEYPGGPQQMPPNMAQNPANTGPPQPSGPYVMPAAPSNLGYNNPGSMAAPAPALASADNVGSMRPSAPSQAGPPPYSTLSPVEQSSQHHDGPSGPPPGYPGVRDGN